MSARLIGVHRSRAEADGEEHRQPLWLVEVRLRGLRRLFDLYATEAILADEVRRHGSLPPRIAALLGRLS
ncbi:MAG: hypothetical protein M3P51_12930 [Chloroflexota bacterium]|nr:hypothetical protein [Chloroflexota bacterium]